MPSCDRGTLPRWSGHLLPTVTVLLIWAGGCGTTSKATVQRTVIFKQKSDVNSGRPMYVLLRSMQEKDFFTASYRKTADMVYPQSDDKSVLRVVLIWPNREQRVKVDVPKDKAVGIFCMFTQPGHQWKVLLNQPLKPEVQAVLDRGNVKVVQQEDENGNGSDGDGSDGDGSDGDGSDGNGGDGDGSDGNGGDGDGDDGDG